MEGRQKEQTGNSNKEELVSNKELVDNNVSREYVYGAERIRKDGWSARRDEKRTEKEQKQPP